MTREEAIKELNTFKKLAKSESGEKALDVAVKALEQEPKTGQWIDDCGGAKCSCCGYCIDDYYYVKTYCPNCGARMEAEEE